MTANSFASNNEAKERERQELNDNIQRFLAAGGTIIKTELPATFPVPRPQHRAWYRVVVGYAGRTAYQKTDGSAEVEDD